MMFGWLAHAFAATRPSADTAAWTISRTSVLMSGTELAARLPLLGGVLYLPACTSSRFTGELAPGWLVTRQDHWRFSSASYWSSDRPIANDVILSALDW